MTNQKGPQAVPPAASPRKQGPSTRNSTRNRSLKSTLREEKFAGVRWVPKQRIINRGRR